MRRIAVLRAALAGDDRGLTAIIVGLLMFAFIGFGAYVIDVGALYEERRDLQNGADAAVLAVATDCIVSGLCSPATAQPEAERLAGLNSNDGQATVDQADITFDTTNQTVTVTVHTLDASDGDGEIDFVLAPVIGRDGQAVIAEATASWGAPSGLSSIPVTISACEWEDATTDPITGDTVFGDYVIIYLHDSGTDTTPCADGPGMDIDSDGDRAEGGFGYLAGTDCSADISVDGFVAGKNGNGNLSGSADCEFGDIKDQTLLIPIFDDITADGTTCGASPGWNCYHVYGFAAFHVVDVDLTGGAWNNEGDICPSPDNCLGGQFVEFIALADIGTGGNPPDLGVYVVGLSG